MKSTTFDHASEIVIHTSSWKSAWKSALCRRGGPLAVSLVTAAVVVPTLLAGTAGAATVGVSATSSVHLVSGSKTVTDNTGQQWISDSALVQGGRISTTTHAIAGTVNPGLFQSERVGVTGYKIPAAAGTYLVTLNLADNYWTKANQRVFDVTAEGKTVESAVDVVAAVGEYHADQLQFTVPVADGTLNLGFTNHVDQATIGSLSVVALAAAPTTPTAPVTTPTVPVTTPTVPITTPTVPVTTPTTPAVPVAAPVITPESFGAIGNGVTDDTVALQKAFDSAPAGTAVYLAAGKVYAHSALLYMRTNGLHVTGPGVLLATKEATSSVWIQADNVLVDGGVVFRTASTTQRWGAWEQMGVRLDGHTGITLRNITVDGSAAAGIYVGGASSHFTLDHVTVENTRADGIHMTEGANSGQVISPTVINSGDDGVAIVSYTSDGAPDSNITVTSPRVLGTTWGRGLSVVGGSNITETNIDVENSDAAAVYIAAEGSPWFTAAPRNVTITGGTITNANTDPTIDHGAVLVLAGETGPTPTNVTVSGLTITNTRATASRDIGVITYGTAPSAILFSNLMITGGPTSAYQGNTPQASYQTRNIIQNGTTLANQG
jgi:Malectin domain/Pectate lyase superfamily protein